jgi:hypothetical protein
VASLPLIELSFACYPWSLAKIDPTFEPEQMLPVVGIDGGNCWSVDPANERGLRSAPGGSWPSSAATPDGVGYLARAIDLLQTKRRSRAVTAG